MKNEIYINPELPALMGCDWYLKLAKQCEAARKEQICIAQMNAYRMLFSDNSIDAETILPTDLDQ